MNHQWSPAVTRAMHQFVDAAPVAPSWTAVDEHRPTPSPHRPRRALVESEQHLDPVKEIYVSLDSPTSETTSRRRLAVAAAAVIAVIGVAALAFTIRNSGEDVDPSPAAEPTVAPRRETGSFSAVSDVPAVSFIVPDGWTVFEHWTVFKAVTDDADPDHLAAGGVGVAFMEVSNLYADPCQWRLADPPVGATVDDLVAAWANVPGVNATTATDITVDGYVGKQIEFTVPDYEQDECRENKFGLWQDDPPTGGDDPNYWAQGPNQHTQLWILDVDGTRVVIGAISFPTTTPQDRAVLEEVLASIQIG